MRLASGGLGWGLDPPGAPCLSPLVRVGLSLPIWKEGCLSLPYLAVVSIVELTHGPGTAGSGRLLFLFFIIIVINYMDLNFPPQPFFFYSSPQCSTIVSVQLSFAKYLLPSQGCETHPQSPLQLAKLKLYPLNRSSPFLPGPWGGRHLPAFSVDLTLLRTLYTSHNCSPPVSLPSRRRKASGSIPVAEHVELPFSG